MNSVQTGPYVNVGSLAGGNLGAANTGNADAGRVGTEGAMHVGAGLPAGYMNPGMGGVGVMHPGHVPMMPPFYTQPSTDDQPVYVNAKQYTRILKRREARKRKYGDEDIHGRNRRKPFIHESRHRHAMNRERGAGGRFLSRPKDGTDDEAKKKPGESK